MFTTGQRHFFVVVVIVIIGIVERRYCQSQRPITATQHQTARRLIGGFGGDRRKHIHKIRQETTTAGVIWRNGTSLKNSQPLVLFPRQPTCHRTDKHTVSCERKVRSTYQLMCFIVLCVKCDQIVVGVPYKLCNIQLSIA